VGRSSTTTLKVSHLLFANATIVFCDYDCEEMVNLCCVLTWFQAVSGLQVNLAKSSILPVGQVDNIQLLAGVLGYNIKAFRLLTWVSLLVLNSRRKLFGMQLLKSLRNNYMVGSLITFQKGED